MLLGGELPSPRDPPSGCVFRTRCPLASAECAEERPPLREIAAGHFAACLKIAPGDAPEIAISPSIAARRLPGPSPAGISAGR